MDGVINVYKPVGMSSFDVVREVKKIAGTKKVGHAGTLDPAASGVLPVCVGKATKIIDYIMTDNKTYEVELKLGVITDTYDREGKVLSEKEVFLKEEDVINCIMSFEGESYQVPPMYSAIKMDGKRLYELARNGIEVERKPRKITIFNIEITKACIPFVEFKVICSKGTYIRSLCYDIGEKLGCGGMMNSLERAATGSFSKDNAVNINDLNRDNLKNFLISMEDALKKFESLIVNEKFEKLLINGVSVKDRTLTQITSEGKLFRVYNSGGSLIGIGIKNEDAFKLTKLLI